jgi:hypothetical protein
MHSSLPIVIGAIVVLACGVLSLYCYRCACRRNQWRARWKDFILRYAELDRELDRIWECR